MRRCLTVLAAPLLASMALAQSVPPALFARVDPKGKLEAMRLSKLKVDVRVLGYLAETKMTMTFHNPHNRVLEGDLYFPLPEGSTVSGYALDIRGQMVDGVVVGKTKARQVYEKIVRQGIDPGLVEWVKGSNFKTRVFPIPAKGSRTIRVDYVADLIEKGGAATYRLPMHFKSQVGQFDLKMEVVKGAAKPEVAEGGPAGLAFGKFRDSFVAETHAENATLAEDLVVALPEAHKQRVLVEKAPDGKVYFAINDHPLDPRDEKARRTAKRPQHIAVLWDASASRAKADHKREIGLLSAYIASLRYTEVPVTVIVFRNVPDEPRSFAIKNGDCSELAAALGQVRYDGGTQIGALALPKLAEAPDLCLLFTDGISNFGKEAPGIRVPVYIFNGQATANHSFLRYLALKTGGEYFNLARLDDEHIIPNIGSAAFAFLRAAGSQGGDPKVGRPIFPHERGVIEETHPRVTQPIHGRFTLVGILAEGDVGQVRLLYGASGKPLVHSTHLIRRADAAEGNLLRRFWAQKKVEDLSIFPKRNEQEITYVGKKHGIVTPHTSLIVLDSLRQYVEHQILPPKTLPKVRQQYIDIMEKRRVALHKQEADKLKAILALWQQRVKWWETEFKYPPNFKYQAPKKKAEAAHRPAATGEAPPATAAPRPAPEPAAPPPAPPRPGADRPAERERSEGEGPGGGQGRGGGRDKEAKGDSSRATAPAIAIKAWDPKTPYLAKLKAAKPDQLFDLYLQQRAEYGTSPAFFLDCADFLLKQKNEKLALQVLSNVAELELENAALVRVLAHKLAQLGRLELAQYLFEEALRLRPEEPQSHRDLALVLAQRADQLRAKGDKPQARKLYERAIGLLAHVVMNKWDRFREIELIALMELNTFVPKAKSVGLEKIPLDPRLVQLLDVDVRIILTWDADNTDMDLHVLEPSGEEAYYGHRRTVIGGNMSRDFTRGYGPEEYCLRKAMRGMYTIKTKYFGSSAAKLIGAVTLQVDVFTNYGRPNQERKSITLRLTEKKETFTVGQIEF